MWRLLSSATQETNKQKYNRSGNESKEKGSKSRFVGEIDRDKGVLCNTPGVNHM